MGFLLHKMMKTRLTGFLFLLLGLLSITAVITTPNTNVSAVLCNSETFTTGDPFGISLNYVVSELETVTPSRADKDFINISPYPNTFAYGHAACNQNLTTSDCGACLGAAKAAMFGTCNSRIGARAVLVDCNIRYEQYPFDD